VNFSAQKEKGKGTSVLLTVHLQIAVGFYGKKSLQSSIESKPDLDFKKGAMLSRLKRKII
jgi:hypothetical protein